MNFSDPWDNWDNKVTLSSPNFGDTKTSIKSQLRSVPLEKNPWNHRLGDHRHNAGGLTVDKLRVRNS